MGHFGHLIFPKTGKEIVDAASKKKERLVAKVREREARIKKFCDERALTVADFFANLDKFMATSNALGMNVGEQAQLREEASHIAYEKGEIETLDLIIRNIPHDKSFDLDFDELRSLEF
jgi:hypothetical protein